MPMSKDLSAYPKSLFDYFESGYKTGLRLKCSNPQKLRFRLYGLKSALQHHGHPHKFFAENVTLLVRENELIIARVDAVDSGVIAVEPLSDQTAELPLPPLPSMPLPELPQMDARRVEEMIQDPMESALEKLGFFAGVKNREDKK